MSPRRFPIPVHLARIEMGWLAGCFGATDTQRRSRKLREGAPLRSTIYRARRRRATFPSTTPFAALLRLHRLPCMAVSVCRRVWGRMCRGKRPGSALGSQQRPERRGPIRRSRPFGPKRTTPRDGRSGPPAGTARHGSFCCVKKNDRRRSRRMQRCGGQTVPPFLVHVTRYVTRPGSRKPGFGIILSTDA